MPDAPNPQISEADRPFAEWLGRVVTGKQGGQGSELQRKMAALHQRRQEILQSLQKAENEVMSWRVQATKIEGAAETVIELLRQEWGADKEAEPKDD